MAGALCADGHVGYGQPVGGVVAYREHISVSGVGCSTNEPRPPEGMAALPLVEGW